MCPSSDQNPAVLDLAEAATMPKSSNAIKTDSATKVDEAQDVLAPLSSETKTSAMTNETGSLATINEQPESISDELVADNNTFGKSSATESIDDEAHGHHAAPTPTAPIDVRPSPESELAVDKVAVHESARLGGSANRSTTPETVVTTDPIIVVSVAGDGQTHNGGSEILACASTDIANHDAANSEDHKFVDPNDKDNIANDVIKFFYTSSTRKRPSSPVAAAPGCCNPQLHRDSDLYIKAKSEDGKAYVFEVVSATLEKASPKFEAMIYGSHTRGNKEEWVWELDDNP
ncbi:hypothetical protein UCDDA912_g06657 [Diaporthe ampelina]|uniref:Uncharacterized protein n=1 Tax=Diaporthe ampelina TaxID=1214573 RepID=A0A0G2FH56_9PEZI|nr:hypothetical protein UCDDA912_g06657 [Diaporthe ampelina]